jgi:epoxyqueuosine reductase
VTGGPDALLDAQPDHALTDAVLDELRAAGLSAVGVAAATRFDETRQHLVERRDAGLHGGMGFTYRKPDRSTDPNRIVDGARSIVVGAWDYYRAAKEENHGDVARGRVARYAWTDTYAELTNALVRGSNRLRGAGYHAVVVADQNALVDREAARRAGIGWYGHNANLLLTGQGSWFVLGSIVTDALLTRSEPMGYGCGTCMRCIDGCPTGAIVAPGVVDARRCLSWLLQAPGVFPREWRVALGDRMYGCDDCQEVCPPNIVRARRVTTTTDGARTTVDVAAFLDDDDDRVMAAAGRWYVAERDARYLRRNALIVLANTAEPSDARAVELVRAALQHADPLVRAHAVWAAARLGRADLAEALAETEADPVVRDELGRIHDVPVRR